MSSPEVVVKVENLTKTFKIPLEASSGIKQKLVNVLKGKRGYREFTPLNDISFEIKEGEFFGIVGRNGSGKSTLLKTIANIYNPTSGYAGVKGSLVPFIELGVGFNPELTGRENVFLNGALLGFSRREVESMYDEIVEFAEIGDFMEEKLKNYSSGMQVRLAFSIAIKAEGDILLLDEVLAVGDEAFQKKCFKYFEELKRKKKTVILVTHDMGSVKRFCTRAILIENGKIKASGQPDDIANQYSIDNFGSQNDESVSNQDATETVTSLGFKQISAQKLTGTDILEFSVLYELHAPEEIVLGYSILYNGFSVAERNTKDVDLPDSPDIQHEIFYSAPLPGLNPGTYSVSIALFKKKGFELMAYKNDVGQFVVTGDNVYGGGPIYINGKWSLGNEK